MKINDFTKKIILGVVASLLSFFALAGAQPKFTLVPQTLTSIQIPVNGEANVEYLVTNHTKITRTLVMLPINGITQDTVLGKCSNPFTLSGGSSCYLSLKLKGSQLPSRVTSGPEICKTKGSGDNTPTPFLCSQPSEANSLNVTVLKAEFLSLTATAPTHTEVGASYSQTNVASGGTTPYTYSVSTGSLPAGTSLNTGTGTVSGTPLSSGAFSYVILVTDAAGVTATASTSGTMTGAVSLTATPSTYTEVGVSYSQTNVASGGTTPYIYSLFSGTVPAGTSLDTVTGTVSGTALSSGDFSYVILVTDADGAMATASTTGTMAGAVSLMATPSTYRSVGVSYSQTNVASGGTTPYTYSVFSGSVPGGTSLDTATGTVSGTPPSPSVFSYVILVTDADGATTTASTSGSISSPLQVDLSSYYNRTGCSNFDGDFDGWPAFFTYTPIIFDSVNMNIIASCAGNPANLVSTAGQTVTLSGSYSYIFMIGSAANGNQPSQTFTVTYTDTSTQTITQSISDWFTPQPYVDETAVPVTGITPPPFLYGYIWPINNGKTLSSITLPGNSNVNVMAITLVL